jgi:hypothetical protein
VISAVRDLVYGVRGVFRMLGFRSGWQSDFDVSSTGILRSFAGVVFALPAFMLLILSVNHYTAGQPQLDNAGIGLLEALLIWVRYWLLFPIIAAVVCRVLGLSSRFGAWLVVHNWTVVVLIHVQAFFWLLHTAGLADQRALASLMQLYLLGRLFVHWRVATASLGVSTMQGAAAAGIPLVVDWILLRLIQYYL